MKKNSYFLIITVIFGILTYYLGDKVLIPFDYEGNLHTNNLIIMGIFFDITVISLITYLQLIVFKILNINNRERESLRRAFLLATLFDFLIFLRIFQLWSLINLALAIGIIIFIELLFLTPQLPKEEKIV